MKEEKGFVWCVRWEKAFPVNNNNKNKTCKGTETLNNFDVKELYIAPQDIRVNKRHENY